MPYLLCTLGSSWAVVPEAFLLGNGPAFFDRVLVLTSSGTSSSVEQCHAWFAQHHPRVALTILAVEDLPDLATAEDHHRFEEALYRCYFSLLADATHEEIHVCLAGGFKTMSAAAQEAAGLLGCTRLFHITSPLGVRIGTHEEILAAIADHSIRLIDLGSRSGWPTMRELASEALPAPSASGRISVGEATPLRNAIHNRLEAANRLAASEKDLATLPFPQIARWAPSERAWLNEPLDPSIDEAWLLALPKVELHCHLGGFATHGRLLDQVRAAASQPAKLPVIKTLSPPAGWPATVLSDEPKQRLSAYMKMGDNNGSKLLQDPGCLAEHCRLLFQHLVSQNIVYAEIRCSPANYASEGRSPWTVLSEIKSTFDACMNVAAPVPVADPVPASFQLEGSRQFHPFEKDADYRQTWRDLPHRHQSGATAFVTFRLADSLPAVRLQAWHREQTEFLAAHPKPWDEPTWKTYRRQFPQRLEEWLDEPHGECLLRLPEIAAELESALRHFDGDRYILDAFVVMPNHVHVLVKPLPGHDLEEILHSWKSFTAHRINKRLGRSGQLWEHESFDHLLRSSKQLENLRKYIHENPRKAGLADGFITGRGTGLVIRGEETRGTPVAADPASRRLAATHVNLIIIATRKDQGDFRTDIARHLSLAVTAAEHWLNDPGCRIVGVDLAGYEDTSTRAHYFREDFTAAHRIGLGITIHAGENDDAEGIWSAILDINTRRLGHALHLADSPTLLKTVADRRIGIEMCPYANLQIKGFPLDEAVLENPQAYPLLNYLQAGIPVTVNTDNIGISAASLTENFLLLRRLCPGITRLHVLELLRNGIDQAFLSSEEKSSLLTQIKISR